MSGLVIPFRGAGLKVLDFDTECRPLSYLGQDYTTGEVTAIATAWVVNGAPRREKVWTLGDPRLGKTISKQSRTMLEGFLEQYNEADMVTGHFIRGFDLPVLNGALLDAGLPPLEQKLTHDTKNDLAKRKYMSASQENLGALLWQQLIDARTSPETLDFYEYLSHKEQMNTPTWRRANRLERGGIKEAKRRVVGDVRQHVALRQRLLELGWLSTPKVWKSAGALTGAYVP